MEFRFRLDEAGNSLHLPSGETAEEDYFAPGAEHYLQEQCAPPTLFRGFAHRFYPFHTLQSDHRQFRWSAASAQTTP